MLHLNSHYETVENVFVNQGTSKQFFSTTTKMKQVANFGNKLLLITHCEGVRHMHVHEHMLELLAQMATNISGMIMQRSSNQ